MKTFKQFISEASPFAAIVNASSYGPGLYGNPTASGQILTPTTVGVAHKTLPLGTPVNIKDPRTGKSINTKVIDRGPFEPGRDYDLTTGATQGLGYKNYKEFGVRKLDVTPIPPTPKPPKVTQSKGLMYGRY